MKGFAAGSRYRHKSCLDIDIEVIAVEYSDAIRTKMKIFYLNRNWQLGNFVIDSFAHNVEVLASDYDLWSRIQ